MDKEELVSQLEDSLKPIDSPSIDIQIIKEEHRYKTLKELTKAQEIDLFQNMLIYIESTGKYMIIDRRQEVELPRPKGRGFLFHSLNHCS